MQVSGLLHAAQTGVDVGQTRSPFDPGPLIALIPPEATGVVLFWNFAANRFITYRDIVVAVDKD